MATLHIKENSHVPTLMEFDNLHVYFIKFCVRGVHEVSYYNIMKKYDIKGNLICAHCYLYIDYFILAGIRRTEDKHGRYKVPRNKISVFEILWSWDGLLMTLDQAYGHNHSNTRPINVTYQNHMLCWCPITRTNLDHLSPGHLELLRQPYHKQHVLLLAKYIRTISIHNT